LGIEDSLSLLGEQIVTALLGITGVAELLHAGV
jgi:hypothetical protein